MYTKGEWTLNKEQDFYGKDYIVIRGYETDGRIKRIADTWDEANAHLIAAAPDMYEALKAIASGRYYGTLETALTLKALSKAEGK